MRPRGARSPVRAASSVGLPSADYLRHSGWRSVSWTAAVRPPRASRSAASFGVLSAVLLGGGIRGAGWAARRAEPLALQRELTRQWQALEARPTQGRLAGLADYRPYRRRPPSSQDAPASEQARH